MKLLDRLITKEELAEIYKDFDAIRIKNGVPVVKQERHEFTYIDDDGKIIGIATGLTDQRYFFLTDLWVDEKYRGTGIGGELLAMLEDKVRANGIAYIWTWTAEYEAPEFYKKQGYAEFATLPEFFVKNGYGRVGLVKKL